MPSLENISSTTSGDPARDRIDAVAQDGGWQVSAWYTQLKTAAVQILGSAAAVATTARLVVLQVVQPLTDGPPAGDNVA